MSEIADRMRGDWNRRAREDANYYVAFGRREQEQAEFEATAADVVRDLTRELRHLGRPADHLAMKALEIGCGPGRVMLPMSRRFREIHGVDISGEMIRQARERLSQSPNAHAHVNSGLDLKGFADESFDFAYSYAVFQHIPSREVVLNYLREAWRVLKPGGLIRCQVNGLEEAPGSCDTWSGVRIRAKEIAEFARAEDFQLLALEGARTQYMWVTMRKRSRGWHEALERRPVDVAATRVHRLTNVFGTEPLAACRGRFAAIVLWMGALPDDCDLLHLEAFIGDGRGTPFYVGPAENDGLRQLNVSLPAGIGTGLHPVELRWLGRPLCPAVTLRVVPPGPFAPRVLSVSDAIDLLAGPVIRSGIIKAVFEEVDGIERLGARVDGRDVTRIEPFCVDPVPMRYEVNFHLPEDVGVGPRRLDLWLGSRKFPPIWIEVRQI
ncbi:MAG TPA: methyltransferase domain-containing protein [Bryobacteraceae bacterium]|nr:methyltransferase domain-containing protein [Bryobacteraceae bacterium]